MQLWVQLGHNQSAVGTVVVQQARQWLWAWESRWFVRAIWTLDTEYTIHDARCTTQYAIHDTRYTILDNSITRSRVFIWRSQMTEPNSGGRGNVMGAARDVRGRKGVFILFNETRVMMR